MQDQKGAHHQTPTPMGFCQKKTKAGDVTRRVAFASGTSRLFSLSFFIIWTWAR
jgi:hypothetical protein